MSSGRPLRFLAFVAVGWIGARIVWLWPAPPQIVAIDRAILPRAEARDRAPLPQPANAPQAWFLAVRQPAPRSIVTRGIVTRGIHPPATTRPLLFAPDAAQSFIATDRQPDLIPDLIPGLPPPLAATPAPRRSRFFGSAWLFVRNGTATLYLSPGVQLGGSQAGARLGFALTEDRRLAFAARIAAPLDGRQRDLAFGLEWQPTRLPVRIVAEQRLALGGGRGGPTLAAVGGMGPLPVIAGFDLEGYGQAGIIARDGGEGYADGALRIAHPVATLGTVRVDLGAGGWGAVQRGAARVDIGPSLSARIPIGPQPVRVSLDWRQRIAGNASPDSGVVLTLGSDF